MLLKRNLVEVSILFMIFIFIVYTERSKYHPNTGITTNTNFMAIKLALCQTYKKKLPNSIAEAIKNKAFREKLLDFYIINGQNSVNFDSVTHIDEWNKPFEYKKLSICKAILRSSGNDMIPKTKDDIIFNINCYCSHVHRGRENRTKIGRTKIGDRPHLI
jgi:hypothetical protein